MFTTHREAAAAMALLGTPAADPLSQGIAAAREQQDRYFRSMTGEPPAVPRSEDLRIPGPAGDIPLRLALPTASGDLPCIVFVRGAGWWSGGLDSHARTINTLALLSGCAVCAVDYRRTPEFSYPVQRNEVLSTLRWLREHGAQHGIRGDAVVLFGESAGATLALSAAQALRDAGEALPRGMVLFYANAGGPNPAARAYSQWVWKQYLGGADPTAVPGPVPLLQDMRGLPPAWLACGEADPLMKDTLTLAGRLQSAGVPHTLTRWPGMPHAFVMFSASLQPALDALTRSAAAACGFLDQPLPANHKD